MPEAIPPLLTFIFAPEPTWTPETFAPLATEMLPFLALILLPLPADCTNREAESVKVTSFACPADPMVNRPPFTLTVFITPPVITPATPPLETVVLFTVPLLTTRLLPEDTIDIFSSPVLFPKM